MLKSLVKALGIVAGLSMSGWVCAVGMGGINLTSALGEPLKLEIELETASKAETNSLSVRLASPEMFKAAGIEYPYSLPQLKLEIATHAGNDQPYLIITSVQPINEPFVTLLVELSWPSGKLLREYTFLLDPPGYAAGLPKATEVRPVEPEVVEDVAQVPALEAEEEVATSEPLAESIPPTAEQAEEESVPPTQILETAPPKAEETPVPSSNVASGPVTVKRGDTLFQIATQVKAADASLSAISLEQMLVGLYRANQQAFVGNNMNRLRAGQVLRLPDQAELETLPHSQAIKEIRTQTADWHAYRQRLAAASVAAKEATPSQETSGKVSATVSDQTPAPKEAPKEVVKLSKGEAPGDQTTGTDPSGKAAGSTQDKINAQQEEAIAQKKAAEENKARAALLEKNIAAMQRLIELKNQPNTPPSQASPDKVGALPKMSAASAAMAAGSSASAVEAASEVAAAKPAAPARAEEEQPSLLDQLLSEPLYLAAGAALLLMLGGLAVLLKRRRIGKSALPAEDIGSTSGRIAAPVVPSPETGDFTATLVDAKGTNKAPTDDVDPISEADLFLNFGRDEQAEEILKDALNKDSSNHQIHLKLLSIYLNRRDVAAFSAIAGQLQKSGDTKAWEEAAKMGLKLEPNNPMYGAGGSTAATPATAKDTPVASGSQDTPEVAFDVGIAKKQPVTMDFDLGLATTKVSAPAAEQHHESTLIMNAPMDFDVTGSRPAVAAKTQAAEPTAAQLDDLIFDVTAGHEAIATAPKEAVVKKEEAKPDDDLSFALDIPGIEKFTPPPPPAPEKPPVEINFAGISLELEDKLAAAPAAAASAGGQDAQWQDVATKLDLASAYKEMGDAAGAREILEEVMRDGDEQQRAAATALIQQL